MDFNVSKIRFYFHLTIVFVAGSIRLFFHFIFTLYTSMLFIIDRNVSKVR